MSGTSLDGLDIVLCRFYDENGGYSAEIMKAESVPYSDEMRYFLQNASKLDAESLQKADVDFAKFCAEKVNTFKDNIKDEILLIASHGHTVFHNPSNSYTLQIGSGEVIAKLTGLPCVFDFRSGDVALGGQGAPLVPIGDELLFSNFDACLNLGGFSNVSYRNSLGIRVAFDISPVNIVLNELASKSGQLYDHGGLIAASGEIIDELLQKLNALDYYSQKPPKSLSREWVEANVNPLLEQFGKSKNADLLRTFTEHTALQIAKSLKTKSNVLITGGGAFNDFLISVIRNNVDSKIVIPDSHLVNFKEAVVFAFLGLLRYQNRVNCLASVTGASRDSCCGTIAVP